ncbi:hypothetical protein V8B97DRAFT_141307 [Scleroderma yunnanense]
MQILTSSNHQHQRGASAKHASRQLPPLGTARLSNVVLKWTRVMMRPWKRRKAHICPVVLVLPILFTAFPLSCSARYLPIMSFGTYTTVFTLCFFSLLLLRCFRRFSHESLRILSSDLVCYWTSDNVTRSKTLDCRSITFYKPFIFTTGISWISMMPVDRQREAGTSRHCITIARASVEDLSS